jgi:cell division protein FtsB
MSMMQTVQMRLSAVIWPVAILAIMVYFAYHVVQGRHGLRAYAHYGSQISELETTAAALRAEKLQLHNQVQLLQPKAVDPDLLDELARRKLNYIGPDEMVVPVPQTAPALR